LTGAADTADVPASPMAATVKPAIKIVRIAVVSFQFSLCSAGTSPDAVHWYVALVRAVLPSQDPITAAHY
jgi:hypothetical protein